MTKSNPSKQMARLEARISPDIKALWQQAAELEGRTLTDFVIASVQEAAYKTLEKHQILKLNQEDSEALVNALLNPLPSNEALKSAALYYKQVMKS